MSSGKPRRRSESVGPLAAEAKGQIRQTNEQLILAAAERVFAGAGFSGATTAQIAEAAGLPKANIHYYFGSKESLYRAVLARILEDWVAPIHGITVEADPRTAIEAYVRSKMALSKSRPHASKVWANELLHGAPVVGQLLARELRDVVRAKAVVFEQWIAQGRMAQVDSMHLLFTIWAVTQTYADFDVQVCAVTRRRRVDFQRATDHVVQLVLRGCGLAT